jgi:hypothetical protein
MLADVLPDVGDYEEHELAVSEVGHEEEEGVVF